MNKTQFLGSVREVLAAIGGALMIHGFNVTGNMVEAITGLVLAVLALLWGIKHNEGKEALFTGIRKVLSTAGGAAVVFGFTTPEKAEALIGLVGPVLALIWSITSKGASLASGPAAIILFLCLGTIATVLPSCATAPNLVFTPDGCILNRYATEDGQSYLAGFCVNDAGKVDRATVQWENAEGVEVRLVANRDKRATIQYRPATNAPWISWSEKSGILIGPFPPHVEEALDGDTADPSALVPVSAAEAVQ